MIWNFLLYMGNVFIFNFVLNFRDTKVIHDSLKKIAAAINQSINKEINFASSESPVSVSKMELLWKCQLFCPVHQYYKSPCYTASHFLAKWTCYYLGLSFFNLWATLFKALCSRIHLFFRWFLFILLLWLLNCLCHLTNPSWLTSTFIQTNSVSIFPFSTVFSFHNLNNPAWKMESTFLILRSIWI